MPTLRRGVGTDVYIDRHLASLPSVDSVPTLIEILGAEVEDVPTGIYLQEVVLHIHPIAAGKVTRWQIGC